MSTVFFARFMFVFAWVVYGWPTGYIVGIMLDSGHVTGPGMGFVAWGTAVTAACTGLLVVEEKRVRTPEVA